MILLLKGVNAPKEVKHLQTLLKTLGYYSGRIDGDFGTGTENAVIQYQKDNGLTPDGKVGKATAGRIGLQTGLEVTDEFVLNDTSKKRLKDLHPDLVKVVEHAIRISPIQFQVGEGLRTAARQKELMASGATQTLNSRHLTGHAVDLFAYPEGKLSWDWKYYYQIEEAMKQAASKLGLSSSLEWGGDWKSFKDGPHWQLSWKKYPK